MYGSLSFARTNFWTTFLLKLAWPTLIQPNG